MKAGRPKSDQTKPARQARARNNAAVPKERKKADPAERKRGLLAVICGDERLDAKAKRAIAQAYSDGVTTEAAAAFGVYCLEMARAGVKDGLLEYKDLMIALTKIASHFTAAAQLGQGGGGGASITVTFAGVGASSEHPERGERRPPDPEVGDLIETE